MPQKFKIRSMFVAPKGHKLVQFDYSQGESWITAFLANEYNMKQSLMHSDIHRDTACVLFHKKAADVTTEERYIGKKVNHASSYGMQPPQFVRAVNKESDKPPYVTVNLKQARDYAASWHSHYTGIQTWWTAIQEELRPARTLSNAYERPRTFFERWGNELWKEAYAYKPQSSLADHCNGAIHPSLGIAGGVHEIDKRFVQTGTFHIVNQSHDSIIIEIGDDRLDLIPVVRGLMARPLVINHETFTIPVDVEIGERWGELEKWKAA